MAKIHMILQGKGGVGKSVIAALLAQYKASKGQPTLCLDTDPVNATFHGYQALNVHQVALMEEDEIVPRRFDTLVEIIDRRNRTSSSTMAPAPLCRLPTT